MTDKATLLALAERVEAATGPDRNLDADIMRATGLAGLKADYSPHPYTASLDAALTLVPEGWFQIHPCQALVIGEGIHRSIAATSALALTAAALRARAETLP